MRAEPVSHNSFAQVFVQTSRMKVMNHRSARSPSVPPSGRGRGRRRGETNYDVELATLLSGVAAAASDGSKVVNGSVALHRVKLAGTR